MQIICFMVLHDIEDHYLRIYPFITGRFKRLFITGRFKRLSKCIMI